MKKIPVVDLNLQHNQLKNELDEAFNKVLKSSAFIRGEYVDSFENNYAKLTGRKHCISVQMAQMPLYSYCLGLKKGDEVIVPAHSWISTSETVTQAGGKVIFCDTNNSDFTIDCDSIEKKITNGTVGIIPVHLYGQPASMDKLKDIAHRHNLWLIEDCAQAHLATYKKTSWFFW